MTPLEAIAQARRAGRTSLSEPVAKEVLCFFGVAVPRSIVLQAGDDISSQLAGLRPPFALKVISPDIPHKSDIGGVRLGLADAAQIRDALEGMHSALADGSDAIDGFLLEEMAAKGHELVLGGTVHEQFGPVLMLGLGGIFVETLADVTFRICPLTRQDAEEMLQEIRGGSILDGARGGVVANRGKIVDTLMQLGGEGGLMSALDSEIAELDVNPLIVNASGVVAVDARIILAKRANGG